MAHVQAAYFTERDIAEKQRDSFYNPADPWDNGDISFTGGIGKIYGVVVGVFPVLGVPMPFVSAGGSSMIMCLTAAGLVVGLMRSQPQIKQSRQSA